jgi:hypothetical protein
VSVKTATSCCFLEQTNEMIKYLDSSWIFFSITARKCSRNRWVSSWIPYAWGIKHTAECWSLWCLFQGNASLEWKGRHTILLYDIFNFWILTVKFLSYQVLRRHGDVFERTSRGYYHAHGRADDTMNLGGIKVIFFSLIINNVVRLLGNAWRIWYGFPCCP